LDIDLIGGRGDLLRVLGVELDVDSAGVLLHAVDLYSLCSEVTCTASPVGWLPPLLRTSRSV
jgi:hypothetical protein